MQIIINSRNAARRALALAASLMICISSTALADAPSEITWEQLIPAQSASLSKDIKEVRLALDSLNKTRKEIYYEIEAQMDLKKRVKLGFINEAALRPITKKQLRQDFETEQPDLFSLWQRVNDVQSRYSKESKAVNASLDGKTVRIPGYVLPLETDGTTVREFLLVPFVGACIHVPPPPPNQMVFVESGTDYESSNLYDPVWVEGVLKVAAGTRSLSLVDGQSNVKTSYAMTAMKIIKLRQ